MLCYSLTQYRALFQYEILLKTEAASLCHGLNREFVLAYSSLSGMIS